MNFKIVLRILTSLCVFLTILSVFPAIMSPMMFDAPGSESSSLTVIPFIFIATLPISCITALVLSALTLNKTRDYKKACWVYLLPATQFLLIVSFFLILIIFD
jgi:hypothetical protein